ncbi:MAG: hypothetical protein ACRCV9_20735 [Burkholderiaceae bacterium]
MKLFDRDDRLYTFLIIGAVLGLGSVPLWILEGMRRRGVEDLDTTGFTQMSVVDGIWKRKSDSGLCSDPSTATFTFADNIVVRQAGSDAIAGTKSVYRSSGNRLLMEYDDPNAADAVGSKRVRFLYKVKPTELDVAGVWINGKGGMLKESSPKASFTRCNEWPH